MQKEKAPNNCIQLIRLSEEHTIAFKEEMQEAFRHGFEAYNKEAEETNQWQVLPDKDFYQSLEAEGAEAYEAVSEDGQRVGGAIITANGTLGEPMEQRAQSQACLSSAESLPMIFTKLIKLKNVYTENYPACTFLIALRTSWFSS